MPKYGFHNRFAKKIAINNSLAPDNHPFIPCVLVPDLIARNRRVVIHLPTERFKHAHKTFMHGIYHQTLPCHHYY